MIYIDSKNFAVLGLEPQAVELGDHQHGLLPPAQVEGGGALGVEAEAGLTLPVGGNLGCVMTFVRYREDQWLAAKL